MRLISIPLLLAAAILGSQLFVAPIVGLADQGDFLRVLGPLGYAPVPRGPEHKYLYLTREFVQDPSYRQPRFEQVTSELIVARIVLLANGLSGSKGKVDLRLFGFLHAMLLLAALARLLSVTRRLAHFWIAWALMLLVLTDVGYVAYLNSLYTEPASLVAFLFLLAESLSVCTTPRVSSGQVLRWSVFAVFLITAKVQNAALCFPLGAYLIALGREAVPVRTRYISFAGAATVFLVAILMYQSVQPATRVSAAYNSVFYAMLPASNDAARDLATLGLDPGFAHYSGTLPWSVNTGVANDKLVNALEERITPLRIVAFYLEHPRRMWNYLDARLPRYLSLRPEFCGNFERTAGRPPGDRSTSFALWSRVHECVFPRMGFGLLLALLLTLPIGGLLALKARRSESREWRFAGLGMLLAACSLTAFFSAAFGDAYDNTKHQFLFNLTLDAYLVFLLVAGSNCTLKLDAFSSYRKRSCRAAAADRRDPRWAF